VVKPYWIRRARILQTTAVLGLVSAGQLKASALPREYPYRPAFISTISAPPGHTELVVFPLDGKAFKIPIRSVASVFFGPTGRALYGACTPYPAIGDARLKMATCKIDLKTGSTVPVVGSTGLHGYYASAVSNNEDRMVFLGVGHLVELTLPDGKIRTVPLEGAAQYRWTHVSLSPDGERAVAVRNGRLELIHLSHGITEPLGDEFFIAEWSPDGKWLAAVEKGDAGRTILMDATTLTRRRVLGPSELDWSPDSRYLLGFKSCDAYYGTLEAIDVGTGERTTIQSSKCQVNQATTGWVSSEIGEE
jgi:WD40 repeat protein